MQFGAVLALGILLLVLAGFLRLMQTAFPERDSLSPKTEEPLFRRYLAFEASENSLLVIPFLCLGVAGVLIGAFGLLVGG